MLKFEPVQFINKQVCVLLTALAKLIAAVGVFIAALAMHSCTGHFAESIEQGREVLEHLNKLMSGP